LTPDSTPPKDEFDLAVLALTLLRGWKIILACLVAAAGLAYAENHYTPKMYAVHMVVMPSRPVEGPGSPRGAAALAGIQFNLYLQSLTARGLAEQLAKDNAAMAALDQHPGNDDWSPSGPQLQRFLSQHVSVERDVKAASTASIALTTSNPQGGVKFLALLNQAANAYVLAQSGAPNADPKAAPAAPAARVFDGPYALDGPVSPHLRTGLRNALIGGLLVGAALVLLLHAFFPRNREKSAAP
jgi:hypothetical protein